VAHRGDRGLQRAVADPRPPRVARALDGGLALVDLGFRDGACPAVDDQRRRD
jgi:hypothetical protein